MYSNKVVDFGTPAKRSANTVTVHIDGKPVCVPEGTSVMRAAVEAGVQVPKRLAVAVCAWSRSMAAAARPLRARRRATMACR